MIRLTARQEEDLSLIAKVWPHAYCLDAAQAMPIHQATLRALQKRGLVRAPGFLSGYWYVAATIEGMRVANGMNP